MCCCSDRLNCQSKLFIELCMSRVEQRRPHKSAFPPLAHTRALSDGETSVSQSVSGFDCVRIGACQQECVVGHFHVVSDV